MRITTLLLFIALFSFESFGQSTYDSNTYLIRFDPSVTAAEIEASRINMNSTELWVSPLTQARLWSVDYFPYTYNGVEINDINEHKTKSEEDEEGLDNFSFNYLGLPVGGASASSVNLNNYTPPFLLDEQMDCLGAMNTNAANGTSNVRVDIVDSGLSYNPNNLYPNHNFNLSGYFEHDFLDNDDIADDQNGHGTNIASVISHTINKGQGNVNPPVTYHINKTFDIRGSGFLAEILYAFETAVVDGAQIVNFSWSAQFAGDAADNSPLALSIEIAGYYYGVLMVCSAGNNGVDVDDPYKIVKNYPGAYDNPFILAVTTTDCQYDLPSFANYGTTSVDIAAPGIEIPGMDHLGSANLINMTGTSQSTAVVSGIAASLGTNQPIFDAEEIICAIMSTADYHGGLDGKIVSKGVVNATEALTHMQTGACYGVGGNGGNIRRSRVNNMQEESLTTIFPNPVSDLLTIQKSVNKESIMAINIHNSNGQLILSRTQQLYAGPNDIQIDLSDYPGGSYNILLNDGQNVEVKHIIKLD